MRQVDSCKKNAFASYAMLMKQWNIKVVYFTSSLPIIQECKAHGVDVIKEYMSFFSMCFTHSVQVMNQAIFRELVKTLKQMYDASFYGFMDHNLLLSTSIGDVLNEILTGSLHASLPNRVRRSCFSLCAAFNLWRFLERRASSVHCFQCRVLQRHASFTAVFGALSGSLQFGCSHPLR